MGGKITAVAKNISSGMGVISEWVGKGKQALKALFDMLTGDNLGAINIMTKMGLSSDMIASIINAFNTIKGYVSTFVDALIGYYKGLFSGDGNVGASFVRIFNVIKGIALPILQEVIAFIKEKLDMLKQFWDENGAQIMQAVKNFWSIIASIFEFIAPVILFIVKFLWDSVKGVIDGALKIIMGLIKIFAGIFTGDFGKMWEGIKQLFFGAIQFIWNLVNLMFVGNILKAIKAFGTGMVTFFKELGPKLIEFFKGMWDDAFKVFDDFWLAIKELWTIMRQHGESVFSSLWGVVKGIWETGVSIVKGIATGLKDAVVGIFNAIKGTSTGIFNGFKTVILGIWNGLKTGVGGVLNAIKTTVINIFNGVRNATSIWDAMKNVVMAIVNGLKSGATSAFNGLKTAIGGIFNGIKTAITTPIEGAKKIVLGIIDVIKGAFSKMNISIPKPKLPKVSVAMKKTSLGIPYPDFDVSWFAKGGVFNGASVIGVGEAGTEAVVPLQGHRMRPFAETIAKEMPNGGSTGGSGITQPIVIITQLDGREIARETVNPMESLMRGNRDSKLRARGGF
jgi:phage-related protein